MLTDTPGDETPDESAERPGVEIAEFDDIHPKADRSVTAPADPEAIPRRSNGEPVPVDFEPTNASLPQVTKG